MNYLSALVLTGLLATGGSAADSLTSKRNYTVEPISSLPLSEIWALGDVQRVEVGDLVVLLQKYDTEYGLARSGLKYCAIFMLGSMDLGSRPIGFRILTSGACGSVAVSKRADDGGFSLVVGTAGVLQVQVTRSGDVRIDGQAQGKLQR